MVFRENFFPDIRYHVVPVDLPTVAYRSIVKPGMEISITYQYVQYIAGYIDGDYGMAFLNKK